MHHDHEFDLPDEWWAEAGMTGFSPAFRAYHSSSRLSVTGEQILEVGVGEVAPAVREIGIFGDAEDGTPARERVLKILRGFLSGDLIPPVQVVENKPGSTYKYKLTDGAHRFHCAIAAGFTHVPTVKGFDWNTLQSQR